MAAADLANQIQEEYLTCQICQGQFRNPKALGCLHTFCQDCLWEYIKSRTYDRAGKFPCPVCRKEIIIPAGGISAFPTNHLLISLSDTIGHEPESETTSTAIPTPSAPPVETNPNQRTDDNDSGQNNLRNSTEEADGGFIMVSAEGRIIRCGRYGTGPWEMTNPIGISVSSVGDVVVADKGNNRILVFSKTGYPKFSFGVDCDIFDVACTADGNDNIAVAVKTPTSELVHVYNMAGVKVTTMGNSFNNIYSHGISINKTYTAVTNLEGNNVYIFNNKGGKLQCMFGKRGHMYDQSFNKPYYIALTQTNNILVSDFQNHSVKMFDTSGHFITKFGSNLNTLKNPMGVCTDSAENVIIADSGNKQLVSFSASGQFQHTLVDYNVEGGDIKPVKVALSPNMDKMVVLVTGNEYAEIRIYPYTSPNSKCAARGVGTLRTSSLCICL